jgi:hypothetical protein
MLCRYAFPDCIMENGVASGLPVCKVILLVFKKSKFLQEKAFVSK